MISSQARIMKLWWILSPDQELDLEKFYAELEKMGTSIQVGEGDGMYRMHIHVPTEKRYEPMDYVMSLGTITKIAMENLMAQMEDIDKKSAGSRIELANIEPGQIAVVAVSPGRGFRASLPAWVWQPSSRAGRR